MASDPQPNRSYDDRALEALGSASADAQAVGYAVLAVAAELRGVQRALHSVDLQIGALDGEGSMLRYIANSLGGIEGKMTS